MSAKRKTVAKPKAKRVESLGEWKPVHVTGDKPKIEITIPSSLRAEPFPAGGATMTEAPEPNNGPHMLGLLFVALALFAFGLVVGLAVGKLL